MNERKNTIPREYVFKQDDFPLAINFNWPHPDYPPHRHDFEELVIIKNGSGINSIDGIDYNLSPGDVFIMPKGRTHAYTHMTDLTSYNIYFDSRQFGLKRWVTQSLPGFHALFTVEPTYRSKKDFNSRLRLSQEQLMQIWSLSESLDIILSESPPGFRLIALARFMEITGLLARYYEETPHGDSRKVLRIAKAISHMETNFSEEINVESLAQIAHMSLRNFHRLFLIATGKTPAAYLIGLRIMEAAHLLESTGKPITDIAFECGFTDSNYFTRQFRKLMNESPSKFRKRTS